MKIGSPERPLRVAVVGSGPSGFYAAEALLKQKDLAVRIDMFDRLPTPYGLVRGGGSPRPSEDQERDDRLRESRAEPGFSLLWQTSSSAATFRSRTSLRITNQIVYAVAMKATVISAYPEKSWPATTPPPPSSAGITGIPIGARKKFDLAQESAAVIGIGNVAMDVTRILAEDPRSSRAPI